MEYSAGRGFLRHFGLNTLVDLAEHSTDAYNRVWNAFYKSKHPIIDGYHLGYSDFTNKSLPRVELPEVHPLNQLILQARGCLLNLYKYVNHYDKSVDNDEILAVISHEDEHTVRAFNACFKKFNQFVKNHERIAYEGKPPENPG